MLPLSSEETNPKAKELLEMRFADDYVRHVLARNFHDAKELLFQPLLDIHYAHLVMLHVIGILSDEEARRLIAALNEIRFETIADTPFDGTFEDLFFLVEKLLKDRCGEAVAGKLHTARSRNDIDVTMYRLKWRQELTFLIGEVARLRASVLALAEREQETIFPLYTHSQAAQPSTVAHYFLAVLENLERDHVRLQNALTGMNRCPLGACAITGTGFPIDRHLTSDLLAFDGPTANTYGSIASVDYLLEAVSAIRIMGVSLGKVLYDLLLWGTTEFQFLRIGDEFVQPSSIMPQKRNPVALEHTRALLSRCTGQASAVFEMVHNTPFGDIVDVEDDLQPLVSRVFGDMAGCLAVLAGTLGSATFDRLKLRQKASEGWITLTELADTLVRTEGLPFCTAHSVCSRLVSIASSNGSLPLNQALAEASRQTIGRAICISEQELEEILSPENFVASRTHLGGPSSEPTRAAIEASKNRMRNDELWLSGTQSRFESFRDKLKERAASI